MTLPSDMTPKKTIAFCAKKTTGATIIHKNQNEVPTGRPADVVASTGNSSPTISGMRASSARCHYLQLCHILLGSCLRHWPGRRDPGHGASVFIDLFPAAAGRQPDRDHTRSLVYCLDRHHRTDSQGFGDAVGFSCRRTGPGKHSVFWQHFIMRAPLSWIPSVCPLCIT